jgi:uncharacterized protein YkwD
MRVALHPAMSALLFASAIACGPMYGPGNSSGNQASSTQPATRDQPQQVSGPPGAGDTAQPYPPPTSPTPRDPYANANPTPNDPYSGPRDDARDPWGAPPPPTPEPPRPAPEPAPPARQPPPPRGPRLATDAQQILDAHNRYRAQHCAAPLAWSPKLEQVAARWAQSLVDQGCKFGHSGGQYGENLAAGTSGTLDGNAVAAMWYDEIKEYSFDRGGFSMNTGHFTQVVWRDTSEVGCAKATCRGMDIWVCNYNPAGNVDGDYRANVKPRGCR